MLLCISFKSFKISLFIFKNKWLFVVCSFFLRGELTPAFSLVDESCELGERRELGELYKSFSVMLEDSSFRRM